MIGYLAPLSADPVVRRTFRGYQCGLCHVLGAEYGPLYRLLAGPDMVFLNVFLELWGQSATERGRACVVAPLVTRLPTRDPNENTRFAAAFGVYMAVEKLRDDWEDEGGALRWIAWRSLRGGWARARAVLVSHGFPVHEVEGWMRAQRAIEAAPSLPLADAAEPTRRIAALLFAHAAGRAGEGSRAGLAELGARVGGFLFYMDNALDLPKDKREGAYNALDRAGVPVAAAVAAAREEVDVLQGLVATLPARPERAFVHHALVTGFRDKARRLERLSPEAHAAGNLRALLPPRPPLLDQVRRIAVGPWGVVTLRARVILAFLLTWIAPRAAWAQAWWPEGADDPSLDTGLPAPTSWETGDTGVPDAGGSSDCGSWCDPCAASFGWVSCDIPVCDSTCSNSCGDYCSNGCNDSCGDSCSSGCSGG